jgi:hypothetical protein
MLIASVAIIGVGIGLKKKQSSDNSASRSSDTNEELISITINGQPLTPKDEASESPTTTNSQSVDTIPEDTSEPVEEEVSDEVDEGPYDTQGISEPEPQQPVPEEEQQVPEQEPTTSPTTDIYDITAITAPPTCNDVTPTVTDVIIIGAGAAGLSAAARIYQETGGALKFAVLECRSELGGRVQSEIFGDYLIQRGATWLNPGHPTTVMYENDGRRTAYDNFLNGKVFTYTCGIGGNQRRNLRVDGRRLDAVLDRVVKDDSLDEEKKATTVRFLNSLYADGVSRQQCTATQRPTTDFEAAINQWREGILPCVEERADEFWEEDVEEDWGLSYEYSMCGWDQSDPLQFLVKYLWHDWEYATDDGSVFSWFDPYAPGEEFYLAADDWAATLGKFARDNYVEPIYYNHRVDKIKYDIKEEGSDIRARVYATNKSTGECAVFDAKRVILTVSAGVYNNDLIKFEPPLRYSDAQYNPLKVENYVKIFYKFPENFWGQDEHYIFTLNGQNPNGIGMHWQNYDRVGIYPGSNMLLLTLVGNDFERAVGTQNVRKADIDKSVLSEMLEPLRIAFRDTFVEPIMTYNNKFHADPDFGYGAYAQWASGYTPYDYFHFWGAYDFEDYLEEKCDHNGCNGEPGEEDSEWILYLSGTNACMEQSEFVHGAYYGGLFSANLAMQSLGIDIDFDEYPTCYEA